MRVLGIGNALVDILIQLENDTVLNYLDYPKGSMQLIDLSKIADVTELIKNIPVIMASGGSAANTIHGLARLGISCGFIGKVGKDELGDFYINDLKEAGVKAYLEQSKTVTGRSYALITPDSERTFATYLGAAVELYAEDLKKSVFSNYEMLHIEGYLVQNPLLIEMAMQIAKKEGLLISLDLASFNVVESNLTFLKKIVPEYVDIVFANEEEARAYTGKTPSDALKELAAQVKIAIVKTGKKGSMIRSGSVETTIQIKPVIAVDTTGAGDQYAAGFLYGYLNHLDFHKCGEIGSTLAASVISTYGARIPEKSWPEIIQKIDRIHQY